MAKEIVKKNLLCRLHEGGEWLAMRMRILKTTLILVNYSRALLNAILESGYTAITAKKV
jgi:hypothetical protein